MLMSLPPSSPTDYTSERVSDLPQITQLFGRGRNERAMNDQRRGAYSRLLEYRARTT